MSKPLRELGLILALALGVQNASGFTLLGSQEGYQVADLGYEAPYFGFGVGYWNWAKNIDDEYRENTKVLYYSYDPEFISYFGSNGIAEAEKAFAMYNALTNASDLDPAQYPLESRGWNYTAQALQMYDLRSAVAQVIIDRYGLGDPDHFTWTLRNRALLPGASCPDYAYSVIKRNFDPLTLDYSSYVNGNLLTYEIIELCPNPSVGSAEEYLVDPLGTIGSAVASRTLEYGQFTRSFSRDDIGGLHYLMSAANLNWETTTADAFVYATNTSQAILLYPSNLQVFAEQALTNNAADLQALYGGLQVTGTSNFFVNVVTTNVTAVFTNYYTDPVGAPPRLVLRTNYSTNVATHYSHRFGNIMVRTNSSFSRLLSLESAFLPGGSGGEVSTNCVYSLLTTNIAPSPYLPPNSPSVTNVTLQSFVKSHCLSGSFFILPTNLCDYQLWYTQLTQVVISTNFLTNTFTSTVVTNAGDTNISAYYEFSQSILTYFTNRILVVYPVSCPDQITSLFEGIEKVTWVRRDYDSLLGQFFQPVTTNWTMTEVTNNRRVVRHIERTITGPDFLLSAGDITSGGTSLPVFPIGLITQQQYATPGGNPDGPGTIIPGGATITLNKVGPFLINILPGDESFGSPGYRWGSFDGSTNTPIVYPVGSDITALENMVLLQLTQPTVVTNGAYQLPDGSLSTTNQYSFQLQAVGGQQPYTWTLAPGSAGLPFDLHLDASTGVISGSPMEAGTFDFTIRLTESGARYVDNPFTLTINP